MGQYLHRHVRDLDEAQTTLEKLSTQVRAQPGSELNMLIGYSFEIILDDIEALKDDDTPDETIAEIEGHTQPCFERLIHDLHVAGETRTLSPLFSRAACAKTLIQLRRIQTAIDENLHERAMHHAREDEEAAPYLIAKGWDVIDPVEPVRPKLRLVRN